MEKIIRFACEDDISDLEKYEHHISDEELKNSVLARRIILMKINGEFAGWLRFNLFWDNTPFMNMLYFLDKYRRSGHGSELVRYWEKEMLECGYKFVLTSTLSNESAQFFYRKNGYVDCGSLLLEGEALEIIFMKNLKIK